jgi:heme/copper-type cytochrome/quinol oxidase subunit 2
MTSPKTISELITMFIGIVSALIPFMGALAFLVFMLAIVKFIRSAGNEKEIKESKNLLIWGVIGLFILVSIWGIISFMKGELGFSENVTLPQIPEYF